MPQSNKTPVSVQELIRQRISRRTYRQEPLPLEVLDRIILMINEIHSGPLGIPIAYTLVSLEELSDEKLKLGTYGFIHGARYFIAGQMYPSGAGFLDYGYTLEKIILELTRMGLGTCWLGGTFNRREFAKAIRLQDGQVIPAITPVGFATSSRGFGERIIRLGAGSDNRLPAEKLFFNRETDGPFSPAGNHPYTSILESVRLAPSASNNQPWRIVAGNNRFDFHICRKPGYQKAISMVDMQMIDMGIAMAHFDLAARENNRIPEWKIFGGTPAFGEWEYVISVLLA
jgi:nitroreductase